MKVMEGEQPLIVQGHALWVVWDYDPPRAKKDRRGRAVACYLKGERPSPEAESPVLAVGVAHQHPTDPFDRFEGRKHALKYALEASPLTREERKRVWRWYFTTHRQPAGLNLNELLEAA